MNTVETARITVESMTSFWLVALLVALVCGAVLFGTTYRLVPKWTERLLLSLGSAGLIVVFSGLQSISALEDRREHALTEQLSLLSVDVTSDRFTASSPEGEYLSGRLVPIGDHQTLVVFDEASRP